MNELAHSPEFVAEMKEQLLKEQKTLKEELQSLGHKASGQGKNNYEANFPDYGRHDEENVTETADYLALQATTETLEQRLVEVEAALGRIEEGGYGMTPDGDPIPEERLRANPAATDVVKLQ